MTSCLLWGQGIPVICNISRSICIVFQNDILTGTLTVRENLAFSANLRLSLKEYSSSDKEMRVDSIIQELGLKDCADTKVMKPYYI